MFVDLCVLKALLRTLNIHSTWLPSFFCCVFLRGEHIFGFKDKPSVRPFIKSCCRSSAVSFPLICCKISKLY